MLKAKLLAGGGAETLYVDDAFSAYTYTGNGSTQTITNGIDLSGQGGMVWFKSRSAAMDHWLVDTDRTGSKGLYSNATSAQATATNSISAFNSNGFSITNASGYENSSGGASSYISWTFRKAPKFFDVVTWTGNGANRTIAHSLGQEVGMILVKRTDTTSDWQVYHRSLSNVQYLVLNTTAAQASDATRWNSTTATTSVFSLGTEAAVNASGGTYVAYLFAHDTGTDGIIQCGSFTTDGSGNATVNHGWSAGVQFAAIKASSTTGDWEMYDTARTAAWSGSDARLRANLSNAEDSVSRLSASGTSVSFAGLSASATYVYLFIVTPT